MSAHYNDSLSLEPKLHTDHESTMGRGSIGSGGDGRCHGGLLVRRGRDVLLRPPADCSAKSELSSVKTGAKKSREGR